MPVSIATKTSRDGSKIYYYLEIGKSSGQRFATNLFTYSTPKDQIQRNHNKETRTLLEVKKSELTLEMQSMGSSYLPAHRAKVNFLDFYATFVKKNARAGNRSLECSLSAFRKFLGPRVKYLYPVEVTENLCERYRQHLLDTLSGETPADYFRRFKRVIRTACKQGYFKVNPVEDLVAKAHPSGLKEIIEVDEYIVLMNTYCSNHEVKKAAIFSLYTGLRWCDISVLTWDDIREQKIILKAQQKTGVALEIPLHPIAKDIIGERKQGRVFRLPTQDGANKVLGKWVRNAGINKHITWHGLRHSMSVLLQEEGVAVATVAGLLGHTSTKYVHTVYKRYRKESGEKAISLLPDFHISGT